MSEKTDEPDGEPPISMEETRKETIDPIEGTSSGSPPIDSAMPDESSNDSVPSTSLSNPGEPVQCETCPGTANLSLFKQKTTSSGKQEDIFRNYCNICKQFFGMCSKKVRGVFTFVTDEGRILTNAEKMEFLRAEKRKKSLSRKDSEQTIVMEESIVENSEDSEVFAEKSPKKNAKGKKKSNIWSSPRKKGRFTKDPAKKPSSSSSYVKKAKELVKDVKEVRNPEKRPRPGRPPKNSTVSNNVPVEMLPKVTPTKPPKSVEMADSSAQTDVDILLKSTYLEEKFKNAVKNQELDEKVSARLQDQPLILKKQFVTLMKTIEEQNVLITKFRDFEGKYQMAVRKLKEFGRTTRLTYSDNFRNIRTDLVERKEEFKAHESEVASIMKKQRDKYEMFKKEMFKKYEDHKLEMTNMEAKLAVMEQEKEYEHKRAEFYLRKKDVFEKERNEAVESADTAVKNLNDRLYVANNEMCAHCNAVEKVRKKMMMEVAEMTTKTEKAVTERNEMVEKASIFESAAQKLGKDCDAIKYERDSWKAYAEKYKKEVNKLTQTVRDKEKELAERVIEVPATPKSVVTPKSVACTPNIETDRVSPPEDGEIIDTPPLQASPKNPPSAAKPAPKPAPKPLVQKIAEKKAPPPQIAAGFESWIPKDKLDAPAPEIPKALTAFGVPKSTEKPKCAPSQQHVPWEKTALATAAANVPSQTSLAEALSRVQADAFLGAPAPAAPGNGASYMSKSYAEEMNKLMKARKRGNEEPVEEPKKVVPQKKTKNVEKVTQPPPTPTYKPPSFSVTPSTSSSAGGSSGSLSNMKKIPKLSDKPPQAEFAPALGVREDNGAIPGLGLLDEKTKEKEKEELSKRIAPAPQPVVKKQPSANHQNQKKKAFNAVPWDPPPQQQQQQKQSPQGQRQWRSGNLPNLYGIQQSSQLNRFEVDNRPWSDDVPWSDNRAPVRSSNDFSPPWHRTHDTPFGKIPIRDTFTMGGPPPSASALRPPPNGPPGSFYTPPRYPPQNQNQRGNPRSFYN